MLLVTISLKPHEGGTFYIQIQFCSLTQCSSPASCQLTLQRFTSETHQSSHTGEGVQSPVLVPGVRCSRTCAELLPHLRQTPTSWPGFLCGHLNCRGHFKRSSAVTNESFFSKLHLSLIFHKC